jgi:hypothetical protein
MRFHGIVQTGQTRTTTEPLACTDDTILPADSIVTVTGREPRGWTVEAEDGRVAEWVSGAQLGLTISEED